MESSSTAPLLSNEDGCSLKPLRAIMGIVRLIIVAVTAFTVVVYICFWPAVPLRFFSVRYSRKIIAFFSGIWISILPVLFPTKLVLSGDRVPEGERRVLLVANHTAGMDWLYLWYLGLCQGRAGNVKFVFKGSVMNLPVFGWGFHTMEYIPVWRNWEVDELKLKKMLSTFTDPRDPIWLGIFPEGTNFTKERCTRSQKYASEKGLPILNNLLLPKTKGFYACLQSLRGSLDAVYDVSIGYRNRCPSVLDVILGVEPSVVHIHIRRIPLYDLPKSEDQVFTWLMNGFSLKDKMLSDFYSGIHFPSEGIEGELSTLKCIGNLVFMMIVVGACTYLFFFTSMWFKLYTLFVCTYLALATYFHIRFSPLFTNSAQLPA